MNEEERIAELRAAYEDQADCVQCGQSINVHTLRGSVGAPDLRVRCPDGSGRFFERVPAVEPTES